MYLFRFSVLVIATVLLLNTQSYSTGTHYFENPELNSSISAEDFSGKVTSSDGTPIAGATVELFGLSSSNGTTLITETDANGEFNFTGLNFSFPFRVLVSHPNFIGKKITIQSFTREPLSVVMETSVIDFNYNGILLSRGNSEPITGARVSYSGRPGSVSGTSREIRSDENGMFSLPLTINLNQPGRSFYISFKHPDYLEMDILVEYPEERDLLNEVFISSQNTQISISGTIFDFSGSMPIELATVQILSDNDDVILSRPIGTATDEQGNFDLNFKMSLPYKLQISHVSYETRIIRITRANTSGFEARMRQQSFESGEIVVQASLVAEEELSVPRTFDRVSSVDVQQVASFSVFDLVSSLREVDIATQSMNMQSVSTRGFNTGANPRFLQLTDGVDNQIPGLGFPIGNLLGPSELDISSIDLVVGSASARYGSSAINGVLLTSSRDMFIDRGLTFLVKSGAHSLNSGGGSALGLQGSTITDASFRYANTIKSKFGYKVTGGFTRGSDWRADNFDNIGPGRATLDRNNIAGYNGVNVYSDERFAILRTDVDEQGNATGDIAPTTRTGYKEPALVDYDIFTAKLAAELAYKFSSSSRFSIDGKYGITNTLFTSDSRIRLQDFEVFQLQTSLVIQNFEASAYTTTQRSGTSYNVNRLSEELTRLAKADNDWFRDFEIAFTRGIATSGIPAGSLSAARRFADGGRTLLANSTAIPRYEPGTERFDEKVDELIRITDFDEGAGIKDNSNLYHVDMVQKIGETGFTTGASGRFYDLDSDGTIYPDTLGNDITNFEVGSFLQYETGFLDNSLSMAATIRLDKNESFPVASSQQVAFNYRASSIQFFRFSTQNSFRFPTVREQFLNTNTGTSRLLGGLSLITDPYEIQDNSFFQQTVDEYYQQVSLAAPDTGVSQGPPRGRRQAELALLPIIENGLVTESDLVEIKPEKVWAFEFGMRRLFSENLYLDLNYFFSYYRDFIGIKRFVKPRTSPSVDLYASATQSVIGTESEVIHVYSNSTSNVVAQGMAFDLRYVSGNFFTGANGTWTQLLTDPDDPVIPGYNTPPFKINFEWGSREIIPDVGFKINYKYRAAHDWQSSFLDGRIESYSHLDFQFNISIPTITSMVKFGVTNFGVQNYYDVFAGPNIGTIVFASFTYDPSIF